MKRREAIEKGIRKYNTGKRCARGHKAIRYAANGKCVKCCAIVDKGRSKAWRDSKPDYQEKQTARNRKAKGFPEPTRPSPEVCECCLRLPGKKSLALDHCHETGKFRGWLCDNCNLGIGKLGDNSHGIIRALNYLTLNT